MSREQVESEHALLKQIKITHGAQNIVALAYKTKNDREKMTQKDIKRIVE